MTDPDPDAHRRIVARMVEFANDEHACGYLEGRRARHAHFYGARLGGAEYRVLLDANFRRAGLVFYRPECGACRECRQMRVLVGEYVPTPSQRRTVKRNRDLEIEIGPPELDGERAALYRRYVESRHGNGPQRGDADELEGFLYRSVVPTLEVAYRARGGRLIGVSILDVGPGYLSSVYHFFDPAESRRSLGVFSAVREIEFAKERGLAHYYLGYLVVGARSMNYKANYRPFEWWSDGAWRRVGPGDPLES